MRRDPAAASARRSCLNGARSRRGAYLTIARRRGRIGQRERRLRGTSPGCRPRPRPRRESTKPCGHSAGAGAGMSPVQTRGCARAGFTRRTGRVRAAHVVDAVAGQAAGRILAGRTVRLARSGQPDRRRPGRRWRVGRRGSFGRGRYLSASQSGYWSAYWSVGVFVGQPGTPERVLLRSELAPRPPVRVAPSLQHPSGCSSPAASGARRRRAPRRNQQGATLRSAIAIVGAAARRPTYATQHQASKLQIYDRGSCAMHCGMCRARRRC